MAREITPRQAEILRFIVDFQHQNNYTPSFREIAEQFDIRSTKAVSDHLQALERRGFISREKRKSRTIRIEDIASTVLGQPNSGTSFPKYAPISEALEARVIKIERPVPYIEGALIAANPAGATAFDDYPVEDLPIDASLFGGGQCFAIKVAGDSMEGAHICDGDLAIIRTQHEVRDGEIAAVDLEGEVTLKYFRRQGKNVMLISANPKYEPRIVDLSDTTVRILGKFVGIVRQA